MSSIYGKNFTVDIFGESHGSAIGCVIGGLLSGIELDMEKIQAFMDRRRAKGQVWATKRKEGDVPKIVSGLYNGSTTGTPLCMLIENTDTRSRDYQKGLNRPGHADYSGRVRYRGFNDPRGGGHFSGRLTAPLVFAGAVASQVLEQKSILAATHVSSIAGVPDEKFDYTNINETLSGELKKKPLAVIDDTCGENMLVKIKEAAEQGDSVGGEIECAIVGVPAGVGSPMMNGVESRLSSLLFSIPAIKAVSFGAGHDFTGMKGSQANDEYALIDEQMTALSNNNGGIIGGITNGMPIVFSVVIKPTPSISKQQKTVNLHTKQDEMLEIKGRHDPCIVPRAVAVVEAAACIAVLDLIMEGSF